MPIRITGMNSGLDTDSIVKVEAKNSVEFDYRKLKWHNYSTTAVVLATLLQELKEETYVYEYEDKEEIDKSDDLIKFKGVPAKTNERMDIGLPALRLHSASAERSH